VNSVGELAITESNPSIVAASAAPIIVMADKQTANKLRIARPSPHPFVQDAEVWSFRNKH
jgi:hypothetical protein